jgi:hypothetical protein
MNAHYEVQLCSEYNIVISIALDSLSCTGGKFYKLRW